MSLPGPGPWCMIRAKRRATVADSPLYIIRPDDSLEKCIAYTREYVVQKQGQHANSKKHFRYDYYRNALCHAIHHLGFDPTDRRVVHLDIGCGPGVFSWVMYDYMAAQNTRNPDPVEYYGYDHCPKMIELAKRLLDRFPAEYEFRGFSDYDQIATALSDRNFFNCNVVITFAHVLVQVAETPVLPAFASLIRKVFPSHSCLVVAVDVRSSVRFGAFRTQADALEIALKERGVTFEEQKYGPGSSMCARLRGVEE